MKSAFHYRSSINNSAFRLLTFWLVLTLPGMYPVHGFDGSDTEVPRLEQMSLANIGALKPNEPIAIVLKTSDDKNWVNIEGTLNIGYSYKLLPGRNTPPNCSTVTTAFSKLEAIEIVSLRSTDSNARKSQTFWLVGYLPAKKELVGNCAEYRDLTQAPVVTVNSRSFKSVTSRGSSTPIVTGGIYLPIIKDESGRSAPTAITQSMQESQFLPGIYNFAPTISCLSYADSVSFKSKNQSALDQFELEAKAAQELANTEGIEIADQSLNLLKQVNLWLEFGATPSMDALKALPTCGLPNSTSSLLKAVNEARTKIKASNTLYQVVCEPFNLRLRTLEKSYTKANLKFSGSRYEKYFQTQNFAETYTACRISPLDRNAIQIMAADLEAFIKQFSIRLAEAEKLLKAKKLTFNLTCSKGDSQQLVTNKTGKCPKGFARTYQPAAT